MDTKIITVLVVAAVMFTAAIGPAYAINSEYAAYSECLVEHADEPGIGINPHIGYCAELFFNIW